MIHVPQGAVEGKLNQHMVLSPKVGGTVHQDLLQLESG